MSHQRTCKKNVPVKFLPRVERLETREVPANFTGVTFGQTDIAAHRTDVADFILDGFNDIITVALNSTQVKIQRNDGAGVFPATDVITVTTANGQEALDVAGGDFDSNNAAQDFAVLVEGAGQNQVQIWSGDGFGAFALLGTYNAGTAADQLIAADFNGDQFIDLATASSTTGTVTVLINDTLGDFSAPPFLFSSGSKATNLSVADAEDDGDHDLIITNPDDDSIRVIRNDGTGNLVDQVISPTGASVGRLIVDHFTSGDDLPDAAMTSGTQVIIFSSNASGLFTQLGTALETNVQTGPMTSGDYDGDGAADLAAVLNVMQAGTPIPTFRIFKNNAAGFSAVEDAPIQNNSAISTAMSARFDQDARVDLAAGASNPLGTFVLLNVPDQVAGFEVVVPGGPVTAGVPFNITVTAKRGNNSTATTYAGQVNLTSSDPGSANLGSVTFTPADQGQKTVQVTMNTAGNFTIFARDSVTPQIAGSSPVTVTGANPLPGYRPLDETPDSSFDRDGTSQVFYRNHAPSLLSFEDDRVTLLGSSSAKDSAEELAIEVGDAPTDVISGEFGGNEGRDGDIATANSGDGTVSIVTDIQQAGREKSVTLHENVAVQTVNVGGAPKAIAAGHFRSENVLDLAVTNTGTNAVNVILNQGDQDATLGTSFNVGQNPTSIVAAPFLGGPLDDLAVVNEDDRTITVYDNQGNAQFQQVATLNTGVAPRDLVADDFDGDGHMDIAVANRTDGTIGVYYGNGQGGFGAAQVFAIGTNPQALGVADFDENGFPDIVAANNGSASLGLLLNAGSRQFFPAQQYAVSSNPLHLAVSPDDTVFFVLEDGTTGHFGKKEIEHPRYSPSSALNGGSVNQTENAFQPSPAAPFSAINPVSGEVLTFYIESTFAGPNIHRIHSDAQGSLVKPIGLPVDFREVEFLESLQRRGDHLVLTARDVDDVSFEILFDALTGDEL